MTTTLRTQPDPATERNVFTRPIRVMRRVRRKHRWMLRVVLAVPILGLVGGVVLTRTAVTRKLVLPRVAQALNMDVSAESVFIGFDGTLVLEQARFRLPGVNGPAGEFLNVARIEAGVDWLASIGGPAKLEGIKLIEPVVVVSHSLEDRTINLGYLSLPASSGAMALPTVTATDARLTLAEHERGRMTVLKHVQMDGWLAPAKDDVGSYVFQLLEKGPQRRALAPDAPLGFNLRGKLGTGTVSATIENFALDQWPDTAIPSTVRGLFNQLHLEGEVPRAYVNYAPDAGLSARLELSGVGMDLPIAPTELTSEPREGQPVVVLVGPPPPQVRLHGLNGAITFARDQVYADVKGNVENLPYHIRLRYEGTSADSPFICEFISNDFRVDRNPRLLPYAPPVVKERLRTFSSPTAIVNTRMMLRRGKPVGGEPGAITISGQMEMRDGVAAFEDFPYEFRDIYGLFRFDTDSLDLVRITGKSPSGAELSAHGRIAPLTDDAQVDVYVNVTGAPIDEAMQGAFSGPKGALVPALFSATRYDELRALGLVQTAAEAEAAREELERLQQRARLPGADGAALAPLLAAAEQQAHIPVFDFRGTANVAVKVHRPPGDEVPWDTEVEVRLPKVGLLPEKFPLPIEATDVVVKVKNRDGQLVSGTFRGLGGGEATVAAHFTVPMREDLDQEVRPEITIDAAGVPFSRLLIHALPAGKESSGQEPTYKRILEALRISGQGAGRVQIHPRADGELGFDADFAVSGATVQPGSEVAMGDVSGRIVASESRVDVELAGQARALLANGSWGIASGPIGAQVTTIIPPGAGEGSGEPLRYSADVRIAAAELAAKLEEVVAVFSPVAAGHIADLRREHRPEGQVDLVTRVSAAGKDTPHVLVEARGRSPVAFDAAGGRAGFTPASGLLRIESQGPTHLAFDNLRGAAAFDGSPVGTVALAGGMLLTRADGDAANPEHVQVAVTDGVVESPLVHSLMTQRIGGDIGDMWRKHAPRGTYQADLTVAPGPDGAMEVRGGVTPRTLVLKAGDSDVAFADVNGSIDFGPGSGAIRALALVTPRWSTTVSGWWSARSGEDVHTQMELGVRGEELAPELTALLPEAVADVLKAISLRVDGPFQLKGAELELVRGSQRSTRFRGLLELDGGALDAGAVIEKLIGSAEISFHGEQDRPPQFEVKANAERFETAGIVMGAGAALVTNGRRAGEILIPAAFAHAHGGRVAAEAKVLPAENTPDSAGKPQRAFTAAVNVSGLRLATLLKDLEASIESPVVPDDDRSRGLVEGSFTVQGLIGQPESRRGRGNFQIAGGRILNVPFMMRMVELSNLQLPTNAKLGYAQGSFFLDGGRINFENLGLYSSAVQILGSGTMTWPDKVLDLRFDTRPARGIPLISGIVRGIRDELITTSVQGTLAKPDVKLKQFPGPRRMLGRDPGSGRDEPPVDSQEWRGEPEERRAVDEGIRPTRPARR